MAGASAAGLCPESVARPGRLGTGGAGVEASRVVHLGRGRTSAGQHRAGRAGRAAGRPSGGPAAGTCGTQQRRRLRTGSGLRSPGGGRCLRRRGAAAADGRSGTARTGGLPGSPSRQSLGRRAARAVERMVGRRRRGGPVSRRRDPRVGRRRAAAAAVVVRRGVAERAVGLGQGAYGPVSADRPPRRQPTTARCREPWPPCRRGPYEANRERRDTGSDLPACPGVHGQQAPVRGQ